MSRAATVADRVDLDSLFKDGSSFKVQKNTREFDNLILSVEGGRRERAQNAILKTFEKYSRSQTSVEDLASSKLVEPNLLIHQVQQRAALEKAGYKVSSDLLSSLYTPIPKDLLQLGYNMELRFWRSLTSKEFLSKEATTLSLR